MKTKHVIILIALIFGFSQINAQKKSNSKIQVALLLDVSNSMDGLIDQAKTELWSVVNELATAKYSGTRPKLEIALYEYGNDGLPAKEGYLKQVVALTTDLDEISEKLFGLKTNGGEEYCGYVIDKATTQLSWSKSDKDLKMIFIAGNESFAQGNIDYKKSCKSAISKGIIINTIFCGNIKRGIQIKWKDGADLADGKYMNIDQNKVVAYIETPYDDEITKLSSKINSTYVSFGAVGGKMKARQIAQDANAMKMNKKAAVSRTVSKSSIVYNNSRWDLVDASDQEGFDIKEVKEAELPKELKGKTVEQKKKYIVKKKEERRKIQKKIKDLNDLRTAYISKQRKKNANKSKSTLGEVMKSTVREQAIKKHYSFGK